MEQGIVDHFYNNDNDLRNLNRVANIYIQIRQYATYAYRLVVIFKTQSLPDTILLFTAQQSKTVDWCACPKESYRDNV